MSSRRSISFALSVLLTAPIAASAQSPSAPADIEWRAQVAGLLARRATAVERDDLSAFEATMRFAEPRFKERSRAWFERTRAMRIATYELTLADDGYEDLVAALETTPAADEVHVVEATARLGLAAYDDEPSAEEHFLTVARRGTAWSIVTDDDLDDLGLLSGRDLWNFGPVGRIERGGVLVFTRGDRAVAARILESTRAAIAYVQGRWPFPWNGRAVVAIPQSSSELSRILRTPIDIGPFVAFTTSSIERHRGAYALTGHRVAVQPATFFQNSASFRNDTLSHEMLHYSNRTLAGIWTPLWLDEGVAQVYGERAPQATEALASAVRGGRLRGLPDDYQFFTRGRTRIRTAYQASASFMSYLRQRFGSSAGARLFRAAGAETPVSFGTPRYHADHAMRAVFKRSLDEAERAWLVSVRRRFG